MQYNCSQCCVTLSCTAKWTSRTYTYTPSLVDFPSHLGHHGSLRRFPCSAQYVPISCLFYTWYQLRRCVSPNLPIKRSFLNNILKKWPWSLNKYKQPRLFFLRKFYSLLIIEVPCLLRQMSVLQRYLTLVNFLFLYIKTF